jgi:hypothetical protein
MRFNLPMQFNSLVTRLALSVPALMRSFSSCLRDHALYLRVGLGLALVAAPCLRIHSGVLSAGPCCHDDRRLVVQRGGENYHK